MKNTTWLHKRWQGIQRKKEKDDDIPEHWDILNLKNLLNKYEELSNKIVLRSSKHI